MNIPISGHSIISLEDAVILGSMKGAVIHKNRLMAICFSLKEDEEVSLPASNRTYSKCMQVPVEEVQFGTDACMLKRLSSAGIVLRNQQIIHVGMNAFDCSGKLLGMVTSIDIDEGYAIKGIYAGSHCIDMENVLNIGDVVLVLGDGNDENECSVPKSDVITMKSSADTVVISSIVLESDELFQDNTEYTSEDVEPKYQYLLHKNLLRDITIANKKYFKGSRIDVDLINTAIKYNCLLNLIMNAED